MNEKTLCFCSWSAFISLSFCSSSENVELIPQEEIAEAPALEPMTEEQLNDLLGEEMYLGTLDWRGDKVDNKRDYSKKKK